MAPERTAILRQLAEIDKKLAADTREALKLKTGKQVDEHLKETLEQFHEALLSGQQRRISSSVRAVRTTVQDIVSDSRESASTRDKKRSEPALSESSEWPSGVPTQTYLRAFEKAAGQKLEQLKYQDNRKITFVVASVEQQRSPVALFAAVSNHILGRKVPIKGRQLCIHIRDGKTPEEAKKLVEEAENQYRVNREYLLAFEKGARQTLEQMNCKSTELVTFAVGPLKQQRSPQALFISVSHTIIGNAAPGKGKQLCIHLRDGKTPDEAKKLVEEAEQADELNREYLLAFERGAGRRLEEMNYKDTEPITFTVGSVKKQRNPVALFDYVSGKFFGKYAVARGKQLCIHLRDGKTPGEAKRLVEEVEQAGEMNREYLLAFERGAGRRLEQMRSGDSHRIDFTVGSSRFQRSPIALFSSVAGNVLGRHSEGIGKQLCIHLRDGKTPGEAKRFVEEVEQAGEVNREYLLAFEKGARRKLEQMLATDCESVTFTVGSVKQHRSPNGLFTSVSRSLFDKGAVARGKQLCIHLRDGKTPGEAKRFVEEVEQAGEVNREYLLAFERGAGRRLEQISYEHSNRIIFTVGSVEKQRSPQALFYVISKNTLGFTSGIKGRQLCIYIRDGKTLDEAKIFVEAGEEGVEDAEFEEIGKLKLEDAIALFGKDPAKLKLYLQWAHPELSEEEIDRLVCRAFRGLTARCRKKEEEYLGWKAKLPGVQVETDIPTKTGKNALTVTGSAPDAECVYVSGAFNHRVRIDASGRFTVNIPLQTGEENAIRIMGIDRKKKIRSDQQAFVVQQTGRGDDVQGLFTLLSKMRQDLLVDISRDPGRLQFFVSCAERVLIKKFARSFSDGTEYVESLKAQMESPVVRRVLDAVLKRFRAIEKMRFPNVQDGSLMFFQKYCAYEIRKRMQSGAKGVNLANDAGLGKTRTVLAALADQEAAIFTPNAVVSTWDEEAGEALIDPDLLVLRDLPHAERKELLRGAPHLRLVTNVQFLQKPEDAERFELLSNPNKVVVHDEAHSRANERSKQSRGAKKLKSKFQINVTATLAKNPRKLRRMLHTIDPADRRFSNDHAFAKAFPAHDTQALKTLKLLVDKYTIRFRKEDVMEEIDPHMLLSQQTHRLPRKEIISPDECGAFEMSEEQAYAIYELFLDWHQWTEKYGHYIPDDEIAREDRLRNTNGLVKRHALRQTVNNPAFINSTGADAKARVMKKIVEQSLKDGRKVVIFCAYTGQAMKYFEMFQKYHPALYTGLVGKEEAKKNAQGQPMRFRRESGAHGFKRRWIFDQRGYPIEDPKGETMSALDYERLTFQNAADRQLIICTEKAGSVGQTFTAGKTLIEDDYSEDITADIQKKDRIHRIDPVHQTHHSVRYYSLQSRYPQSFLHAMKRCWVVKRPEGTYEEYDNAVEARCAAEEIKSKAETAYEAFSKQGTFDQVKSYNLEVQRQMFHLINDGIADESLLSEDQQPFVVEL